MKNRGRSSSWPLRPLFDESRRRGAYIAGNTPATIGAIVTPPTMTLGLQIIPGLIFPPPGLWAWFDATAAATLTLSGSQVTAWADKAGSGRTVTQGTAANRPLSGTRTLNGLNVLDFDGTDFLVLTAAIGFVMSNFTVFVVAANDTNVSNRGIMSIHNNTQDWNSANSFVLTTGGPSNFNQFAQLNQYPTIPTWSSAAAIRTLTRNGSTVSQVWKDQGLVTASAANATATGTANGGVVLGARRDASIGDFPFDGLIAEVMIWMRTLSVAERTAVWNYLGTKWALP